LQLKCLLTLLCIFWGAASAATLPKLMQERINELLALKTVGVGPRCHDTTLYVSGISNYFLLDTGDIEDRITSVPGCNRIETTISKAPYGSIVYIKNSHSFIKLDQARGFEKDGADGARSPFQIRPIKQILASYAQSEGRLQVYFCDQKKPVQQEFPEQIHRILVAIERLTKSSGRGLDLNESFNLELLLSEPLTPETFEFLRSTNVNLASYLQNLMWTNLLINNLFSGDEREMHWKMFQNKAQSFTMGLLRASMGRSLLSERELREIAFFLGLARKANNADFETFSSILKNANLPKEKEHQIMLFALINPEFRIQNLTAVLLPLAENWRWHRKILEVVAKNLSPIDERALFDEMEKAYFFQGLEVSDPAIRFLWEGLPSINDASSIRRLVQFAPESLRGPLLKHYSRRLTEMRALLGKSLLGAENHGIGRSSEFSQFLQDTLIELGTIEELTYD
jgi:hypothetical protein